MGRGRLISGLLVIGTLGAIAAVQFAGAAVKHRAQPPRLILRETAPFHGRVSAPAPCRAGRAIVVYGSAGNNVVTKTRSNAAGFWGKQVADYGGQAHAVARRVSELHRDCKKLVSPVVDFPFLLVPVPKSADLSIDKVAGPAAPDLNVAEYTITVKNLGPDFANGVVVTDTPAEPFVAAGSDGRCGPDGGTTFTCGLSPMFPGATVSLVVHVACTTGAAGQTNSASVKATEADPNPANNSVNGVPSGSCE